MIIGAHAIIYSKNAAADRSLLCDVLGLPNIDVGGGWLIFDLPPSEMAVHPSDENDLHELYLMCDDVQAFVAEMASRQVACGPVQDRGWGLLTEVSLPGGGKLGVYQPRHARPSGATVTKAMPKPVKAAKPAAKKKASKAAKPAARKAKAGGSKKPAAKKKGGRPRRK